MSHNKIEKFTIKYADCVWDKCKNKQKINTIEIFFGVTTRDTFRIEYSFHKIDFILWEQILEIHKDAVLDPILYDNEGIVTEVKNELNYYFYRLESKDFNLYRNINFIFFLDDEKGWNNMNDMLKQNTWTGEII